MPHTEKLIPWKGIINRNDPSFEGCEKTLQKLDSGEFLSSGFDTKRHGKQPIYGVRLNLSARLFFTRIKIDGSYYLYLLEKRTDHNYKKSPVFRTRNVADLLKDKRFTLIDGQMTELNSHTITPSTLDELSVDSDLAFDETQEIELHHYNQRYMIFDEQQNAAIAAPMPCIISGMPGTGKTGIFSAQILNFINNSSATKQLLYVTSSERLIHEMKKHLNQIEGFNALESRIVCRSYHQLLQEHAQDITGYSIRYVSDFRSVDLIPLMVHIYPEGTKVKASYLLPNGKAKRVEFADIISTSLCEPLPLTLRQKMFSQLIAHGCLPADPLNKLVYSDYAIAWFKRHFKKVSPSISDRFSNDFLPVYQEIRRVSGYETLDEYMALAETPFFKDATREKPLYFEALRQYNLHLEQEKKIDTNFYKLTTPAGHFTKILVDESQDFSGCQQKQLRNMSTDNAICFAFNGNQILNDSESSLGFLKTLVEANTHESRFIELNRSYRCANPIIRMANNVLRLNNLLANGSCDKDELTEIQESTIPEKNEGCVEWLPSSPVSKKLFDAPASCAVITLECFKQEARNRFSTDSVFTIEESKGLEYPQIVAYRLLDDRKDKTFEKANKPLLKLSLNAQPSGNRAKKGQRDATYWRHFNGLFTAFTRALQKLSIYQDDRHEIERLVEELKLPLSLQEESQNNMNIQSDTTFEIEMNNLITGSERENYPQQAMGIWVRNLGGIEADFQTYANTLWDSTWLSYNMSQEKVDVVTEKKSIPVNESKVMLDKIYTDLKKCINPTHMNNFLMLPDAVNRLLFPLSRYGKKEGQAFFEVIMKNAQHAKILTDSFKLTLENPENKIAQQLITASNDEGNTLIHLAAAYDAFELLHLLPAVEKGTPVLNRKMQSPLVIAVNQLCSGATFNALVNLGLNPTHRLGRNGTLLESALLKLKQNPSEVTMHMPLIEAILHHMSTTELNKQGNEGLPAIHLAVEIGDETLVKRLIDAGANLHSYSRERLTPLIRATLKSNANIMRLLLEHGANPNQKSDYQGKMQKITYQWKGREGDQYTALLITMLNTDWAGFCLLLTPKYKTNINSFSVFNGVGSTPLYYADESKLPIKWLEAILERSAWIIHQITENIFMSSVVTLNMHKTQLLLNHGALIEANYDYSMMASYYDKTSPSLKTTPLLAAKRLAAKKPLTYNEMYALLQNHVPEKLTIDTSPNSVTQRLHYLEMNFSLTSLENAAKSGTLINDLLFFINDKNNTLNLYSLLSKPENAAVFVTFFQNKFEKNIDLLSLLENDLISLTNPFSNTYSLLTLASRHGYKDFINLFLVRRLSLSSEFERTAPIQTAISYKQYDMAVALAQAGADLTYNDILAYALRHASKNPHDSYDYIFRLIDAGACINQYAANFETPLSQAIKSNLTDIVDYLLKHEVDVNTGVGYLKTPPILFALDQGQEHYIECLLEAGADIYQEEEPSSGKPGRTAFSVVKAQKDPILMQRLLSHNVKNNRSELKSAGELSFFSQEKAVNPSAMQNRLSILTQAATSPQNVSSSIK